LKFLKVFIYLLKEGIVHKYKKGAQPRTTTFPISVERKVCCVGLRKMVGSS
jgi:hypothetical protein